MAAPKVAVYLTKVEVQVLRRLIIDEAKRLGLAHYQHESEWPPKGKRMKSLASKALEARQYFN